MTNMSMMMLSETFVTLISLAVKTSVTRPAFSIPKAVRTSHARPVFLDSKGAEEWSGG